MDWIILWLMCLDAWVGTMLKFLQRERKTGYWQKLYASANQRLLLLTVEQLPGNICAFVDSTVKGWRRARIQTRRDRIEIQTL